MKLLTLALGLAVLFLFSGCSEKNALDKDSVIEESSEVTNSLREIQEALTSTGPEEAYIPILMFHHIEPIPADHPDQVFYGLSFAPEKLEGFLQYFQENNIKTLTFEDLTNIFDGQMPLPEKSVMLTFDDGYTNNYNLARPLLEKYNMVGNFALISEKVPEGGFHMNEAQAKELAKTQHICSHTATHPNLNEVSQTQLLSELKDSQIYLQSLTGQDVKCLVYPAGKNNEAVRAIAKEYYEWARTTAGGKTIYANQKYTLPTVRIFPTTGVESLKTWFE